LLASNPGQYFVKLAPLSDEIQILNRLDFAS